MMRMVLVILTALAVTAGGYLYVRSAGDRAPETDVRIAGNV
mgnify:CR=1 FL=1